MKPDCHLMKPPSHETAISPLAVRAIIQATRPSSATPFTMDDARRLLPAIRLASLALGHATQQGDQRGRMLHVTRFASSGNTVPRLPSLFSAPYPYPPA